MVKFLIGLATGVLLVFLFFVLIFFALLRFREKPPQIADNSVLVLRLEGDIPEKPPVELPVFLGVDRGGATITNLWIGLEQTAAGSHLNAAVVEPRGPASGLGRV